MSKTCLDRKETSEKPTIGIGKENNYQCLQSPITSNRRFCRFRCHRCCCVFDAAKCNVDFNELLVWILVFFALRTCCLGDDEISLSNSPSAQYHTCLMWYGELSCWGEGIYTLSDRDRSRFVSVWSCTQFEMASFSKVIRVNWDKGVRVIIGLRHRIQSVWILILFPFKLL